MDEAALAASLRAGDLHGAALDVFEDETATAAHLATFSDLSNAIPTPHITDRSAQANTRASRLTVDHVLQVLQSG